VLPKDKFTTAEAAEYLRIKPATLEVWRCRGRGPKYQKIGRRVVYDRKFIEEFANDHTVLTADTYSREKVSK